MKKKSDHSTRQNINLTNQFTVAIGCLIHLIFNSFKGILTRPKVFLFIIAFAIWTNNLSVQQKRVYQDPKFAYNWGQSGLHPDHIILNLTEDPSTSMSVTWRTSTDVRIGYAEIAPSTAAPKFWRNAITIKAKTETMDATKILNAGVISNYHSITFTELFPDTLYAYRVGNGSIWSEWIQFRTAAKNAKPFSFLYVGDAQNFILDLWSRLIREGYRKAPNACFIIHAGDLVTTAHSEQQWHEWFNAGGWIHSMLPSISTPGNHEYQPRNKSEKTAGFRSLSYQWRPQFTLPLNGISELEETVYYFDYQNVRVISLNSNKMIDKQIPWIESVLSNNPNKWTIVTFHHPIFSSSAGRNNQDLRKKWKPILDKHRVDLVLQGHDHTYARGRTTPYEENIVSGTNTRDLTGTVYVVSVSGGKMYKLEPSGWDNFEDVVQDRTAENTQLFQLISIDGDTLSFEAYTATGELYDAFDLIKAGLNKPNTFVERKEETTYPRQHNNTISYDDTLPQKIEEKLMRQFEGHELNFVQYFDQLDFKGYFVRLYKDKIRIDLKLDQEGKILEKIEGIR